MAGGRRIDLAPRTDLTAWTLRPLPEVKVDNSEVVFVGYA